ncbi:Glu-tRNA(Gln) amidotransferase subunit GatD [Candidatus Woesearchaeota archaeon]|nr:Glu-tRNA(Gln) amidotransferase subunit GatD [Candidatus Woesearchaeota archaeon]
MKCDLVKIERKDGAVFEGLQLLSPNKDVIVLKLSNGYNIGILESNIKKKETVKKAVQEEKVSTPQKPRIINHLLPKIAILTTGGTIASKIDYETGAVSADITAEEFIGHYPLLTEFCNPEARMIAQMMSESFRFAHYNLFAQEILKEIKKGAKGIILAQGTDTLHYTSAALSFMFENLPVPIVIVGSQRSSDRPSTDAYLNLMNAAYFIAHTDFKGVAVCMHENTDDENCIIMHGCKVRKMHTSRRDAFRPINIPPLAQVNFIKKEIKYLYPYQKEVNGELTIKPFKPEIKVGIVKTHTNMWPEQFEPYLHFDGVVFEGTGIGQLPNTVFDEHGKINEKNREVIKKIAQKTVAVWAPQTIYGRTDMNVYSEGRINIEDGIVGNYHDMTPETAFIKLAWLLSNYTKEETKKLFAVNLRGEISDRSYYSERFLI